MSDALKPLRLNAHADRRLRVGHLWIYSNEVDVAKTPLKAYAPGDLVRIEDARGKPLGVGYINPNTLLCARILSSKADASIDAEWFLRRLQSALALRERLYTTRCYRLVHGESDGLPGVIVDRYGDYLSVQITTAGMERLKPLLLEALDELLHPKGIVLRNDSGSREQENLASEIETIGAVPETVEIDEDGVRYAVSLAGGQKTGFFYDQRDNRTRLQRYVAGKSVLDVFSYVGAWALRAAHYGASSVTCLDSSQPALDAAQVNATLNGVNLETIRDDALAGLKALRGAGRTFDVVIVDPPALIKRKKDAEAGQEHYAALNRAAMNLLSADGILIACSCSHHLETEQLQRILLRESKAAGRRLQLLEQGAQGADHPVHPAIPETRYLKGFFCRVTSG
ncbi:MAG TPA: class I SAM-dependent rRNA methyltransferase [Solimonas sp.]